MKYVDRYRCARHPGYSIGRFYKSDLRKIASLQQYYKYLFPDSVSHDPMRFLSRLMRNESCLFYSVKNGKTVEGYGFSVLLDPSGTAELETFRKRIPFSMKKYTSFSETQLEFLFEELKLRKLYVRIPAPLRGFVSLAKRVGFTIEGILRNDMIFDGKTEDVVVLGILKEEF